MKTQTKIVDKIIVIFTLLILMACNKEEAIIDPSGNLEELPGSISLDEFERDEGEIGISINARAIAKKGHKPAKAVFSINSKNNIEDQTIQFDAFNNIANVVFKNEDLPDEVEAELKEGVPVDITILDETDNVLASKSFSKLSFKSSPPEQEIDDERLEDLFAGVTFREDILHYVQIVDPNNEIFGAPGSQHYPDINNKATEMRVIKVSDLNYSDNTEFVDKYTTFKFAKIPGQDSLFSIAVHNGNDIHYLYMSAEVNGRKLMVQSKANLNQNGGNTDVAQYGNYWFKIEKKAPGLYKIIPTINNNPLTLSENDSRLTASAASTSQEPAYFRILSFDIDWEIQNIETKFLKPIMPPSSTKSAYNSTLRNCSSGSLTQDISEDKTEEVIERVGWSESMSVSSSNTGSISLTVGAEVETSFFGNSGKATSSVTGTYEYTKTKTETKSKSNDLEERSSVTVSVKRNVGVPPGVGISVADVYQTYENVKIPYVQRFRIFGKYQENNSELSGREILTQFAFNSFTGVVTEVQDNFIEVTVRGTTTMNIIETFTDTRDIPDACN
jgi:hypothetical protein